MSAHFVEYLPFWMRALPFAVLGVSLLGSGHCVAMCGGLVLTVVRGPGSAFKYQLGRLVGYTSLGILAGELGSRVSAVDSHPVLKWASASLLAFGMIWMGVRIWMGRPTHFSLLPGRVWKKMSRLGPGGVGLLSAFLPCGWLHVYVLGAVATRSAWLGGVYLFFFWLGTLPALSVAPVAARRLFLPLSRRLPRLSAVLLVLIGLGSLAMKMAPDRSAMHSHCHAMEETDAPTMQMENR